MLYPFAAPAARSPYAAPASDAAVIAANRAPAYVPAHSRQNFFVAAAHSLTLRFVSGN